MRYLTRVFFLFSILIFFVACVQLQVNQDKELAAAYYNLGNAYYGLKDYEKAVFYFQKAINLDSELVKAHYNLSLALVHNKKGEDANLIIEQLLKKDPDNVELLHILGYSYFLQNKFEESLTIFDRILTLVPQNLDASYNKGLILWKIKKFDEGASLLKQVIESLEASLKSGVSGNILYKKALYGLGELFGEEEKWEMAIRYLERYLELVRDDVDAHELLIKSYRELEKYTRVLELYDSWLSLDPGQAPAWLGKAEILLTKVEDPINGLAALNKALLLGVKKDDTRLKQILDAPKLIEKNKVKAIIEEHSKLTK